jgi:hypothetical protein
MLYWTLSLICFDPTATPSREDLFRHALHSRPKLLREMKEERREKNLKKLVTAIAAMHNVVREGR